MPFWYRLASQFSPATWYARMSPCAELIRSGCLVTRIFSSKPGPEEAPPSMEPTISSSSSFSDLRPFFFLPALLPSALSALSPKCLNRSLWPSKKLSRCLAAASLSPMISLFCAASVFSEEDKTLAFLGSLGLAARTAASSSMRTRLSARSISRSLGPAAASAAAAATASSSSWRSAW